jgi:glycosyltransferase involved in cell wall biosynthesis
MKVAILGTRGIPAEYGGFETFAEELSTRLASSGFDITVFCEGGGPDAAYKRVRLRYVKLPRVGPLSTVLYDAKCILKALRGFDIVYMLGYGAGAFLCVPRLLKVTVWVNMDGLEWKRSKWPWYGKLYLRINERLAVKFANMLIADANGIRDYLTHSYGRDISCNTISYGAYVVDRAPDSAAIRDFGLEPCEYYLVVCRLEPENHVKEIITGFAKSKSLRKLTIVGDCKSNTKYVGELLKSCDDRIRFIGTVYDKELLRAIRYHAFAYIHGHSVGGTNPSLLEALGCGNIVIAHDNVFNREVGGIFEYFSDSEGVSWAIHKLESNNAEHIDIARKASHAIIRGKYTWGKITEDYIRLLRQFKC